MNNVFKNLSAELFPSGKIFYSPPPLNSFNRHTLIHNWHRCERKAICSARHFQHVVLIELSFFKYSPKIGNSSSTPIFHAINRLSYDSYSILAVAGVLLSSLANNVFNNFNINVMLRLGLFIASKCVKSQNQLPFYTIKFYRPESWQLGLFIPLICFRLTSWRRKTKRKGCFDELENSTLET